MDANYLDLSHEYYILVPKNKDYADELYRYDIYGKGEINNIQNN
ncbi:hypothetical protein [Succinivibrio sp.]